MVRDSDIRCGDIVVDRDSDDPNEAVVVNTPSQTAKDWRVYGRGLLYEDNPEYPANDPVIIVVYQDTLNESRPNYGGVLSLKISRLNRDGIKFYAFPESRLKAIDKLDPDEIPLDKIDPSPYHARSFSKSENREYIDEIRERGQPRLPPLVRRVDNRWEVVNGHKRIWASHVAGHDSILCARKYLDDKEAARVWAEKHLEGYNAEQASVAVERLHSQLGTVADSITEDLDFPGKHHSTTSEAD